MVNNSFKDKIWRQLNRVQNPSRYVGNEYNAIIKDPQDVSVKVALAFPDFYEVGMSNLGLRILYDIVNSRDGILAERVFAPAPDMEELMHQEQIPLFSLENFIPLNEFDVVGFSLQYELNYTNVINMLHLGEIPLRSAKRADGPLIIGGGVCTYNAEPVAPFFDLFVLGDGEEALPEILDLYKDKKGKGMPKEELLAELAQLKGVYVPCLYKPRYENNLFRGMDLADNRVPGVVSKRVVKDLDCVPYPLAPVVPYREIVHDRAVLEISRGCARGCRFCQAGTTYRPRRHRSAEKLREYAVSLINNTGYDELSLASLSSSDYPEIGNLVEELSAALPPWVNLSLPSLRLDSFSIQLASEVQKTHKSSLTFAPEAGTSRLRGVINKDITEEAIFEALDHSFRSGWKTIKFYFMIGLPTETDEDITAISELMRKVNDFYKQNRYGGRVKLSVSVSTFSPKAHTPFQWEPQIPPEETRRKQKLLSGALKKLKQVHFRWHNPETSFLEAAFARGDRRLADVIELAWQKGCKYDNWTESFQFDKWKEAFAEAGLSINDYSCRRFENNDPLPWDHLSTGIKKEYLIKEHERSRRGE